MKIKNKWGTICLLMAGVMFMGGCMENKETEIKTTTTYLGMDCVEVENKEQVFDTYKKMKAEGLKKGYTPCIIFVDDTGILEDQIEQVKEEYGSLEAFKRYSLESYPSIDTAGFFKERIQELDDPDMDSSSQEDYGQVEQEMEEDKPEKQMNLYSAADKAYIAKVPTDKPYEVFAYIPVGDWNECPADQQHIAVAKYWYEKYGAVPCAIGYDTIQYYLSKPVQDKNSELAKEMFSYCSDIIYQGVETLENLESVNQGSVFWFFWWD